MAAGMTRARHRAIHRRLRRHIGWVLHGGVGGKQSRRDSIDRVADHTMGGTPFEDSGHATLILAIGVPGPSRRARASDNTPLPAPATLRESPPCCDPPA